jgi:hypothetical protein
MPGASNPVSDVLDSVAGAESLKEVLQLRTH